MVKRGVYVKEKEINELVSLLPEVKHRRPLLDRMDALEDQRLVLTEKILNLGEPEGDHFMQLNPTQVKQFNLGYKENLEVGDPERKKAILRSLIESATLEVILWK